MAHIKLDAMPAMPAIAQKILTLDLSSEAGERTLMALIEQDPLISAKLIGISNSPLYAPARLIGSVHEAAMLLGSKRVQSVASGIAMMALMGKAPAANFNVQELWLHSLSVAFGANAIARAMPARIRPPDDQVFLAGLLHDIGFLALLYLNPALSKQLHAQLAEQDSHPGPELELAVLGVTHAAIGAAIARHWNLPEELAGIIEQHQSPGPDAHPLAHVIHMTEQILPAIGVNECTGAALDALDWQALQISPERIEDIVEQVEEQAGEAIQFVSSSL